MDDLTHAEIKAIRELFPIFKSNHSEDKPLVFLDTAASAQKPLPVLEKVQDFYCRDYSNIHRGVYRLSERSTARYEAVREKVRAHINAASTKEIIFTKGTTESLNLLAHSLGMHLLRPGDAVLISALEHHANIVPWQLACERHQAELRVIPFNHKGELCLEDVDHLLDDKVKIVSLCEISNALGTVNPLGEIIAKARHYDLAVIVDGAQAVAHHPVDVRSLDCDFYVFSAHKAYAPSGAGVLYGREKWLEAMPPYQTGGDMIESVRFEKTTFADIPYKFEAGTPPIAQVIGLGAALDWLHSIGMPRIAKYEKSLLHYCEERLKDISGVRIIGEAANKAGLVSFVMDGIHPHDIGTVLDSHGVAVRAGHHCAQPVMQCYQLAATVRASFGIYNHFSDIDILIQALENTQRMFT